MEYIYIELDLNCQSASTLLQVPGAVSSPVISPVEAVPAPPPPVEPVEEVFEQVWAA